MTVSSSVGQQFTIGTLIAMAYRLAGLINVGQLPSAAQLTFARDLLDTMLDGLQAEGVSARARGFENLTLTADTYKYSLTESALDVVGPGMYIAADQTDLERATGETPVTMVSADQWQLTSSKAATGRPTLYYPYRATAPVQVWLWPIPDEAGTVRFQVHRKLADTNDDNATLDLEIYWSQFVLWELAHQVMAASGLGIGRLGYYAGQAEKKKMYAKSMSRGHANDQIMIGHTTRWSRR